MITPTEKHLNDWSRAELLALPQRDWGQSSKYDSILILPVRQKHDSGYNMVHVIGCRPVATPVEIACSCADHLQWLGPPPLDIPSFRPYPALNMDCLWRSGAMRFWADGWEVEVGLALSSTEVIFKKKPKA